MMDLERERSIIARRIRAIAAMSRDMNRKEERAMISPTFERRVFVDPITLGNFF